jgi:hypothetical protein
MSQFAWIDRPVPAELGAIAHGPIVLSEFGGYRIGLRYIVAYRLVMDVALVVAARGPESATLARQFTVRRVAGEPLAVTKRSRPDGLVVRVVAPELHISPRGSSRNPNTIEGHYMQEFSYAIDGRPDGTSLTLEYFWPGIGLEREQCALTIPSPEILNSRIIRI